MHEEELLTLLNKAWKLLDPTPRYADFNVQLPCGGNAAVLDKLESENPQLGLSDFLDCPVGTTIPWGDTKGLTTLSLIATITDVLVGRRLAAIVESDGTISGWRWYVTL